MLIPRPDKIRKKCVGIFRKDITSLNRILKRTEAS